LHLFRLATPIGVKDALAMLVINFVAKAFLRAASGRIDKDDGAAPLSRPVGL
jgi:hypothetical protein